MEAMKDTLHLSRICAAGIAVVLMILTSSPANADREIFTLTRPETGLEIVVPDEIFLAAASSPDPAEDDRFCAYNRKKDPDPKPWRCISGSNTLTDCTVSTLCKQPSTDPDAILPCQKVPVDQCGNNPQFSTSSPFPTPAPRDLGGLVNYIFTWSLRVVGLAVFVMIIYGGFLWLMAGGDPGKIGKGKAVIRDAVLGAVLLLSAYIILNTINPDFVRQTIKISPLPPQQTIAPPK